MTRDDLKQFGLQLFQPRQGYRFSLDALLLAEFARVPALATVADLGTGCGVIPLVLARKNPDARFVAFENNPDMAALASENVRFNGLDGRIEIVVDDILNIRPRFPVSSFDVVISNPPFRSPHSGKVSPHPGRDAARHETTAGLADFLAAAKFLVKSSGRICFIQLPARLPEFMALATQMKLSVLRVRMIHNNAESPAILFMAELAKGRRCAPVVEQPLFVRDLDKEYTHEVLL